MTSGMQGKRSLIRLQALTVEVAVAAVVVAPVADAVAAVVVAEVEVVEAVAAEQGGVAVSAGAAPLLTTYPTTRPAAAGSAAASLVRFVPVARSKSGPGSAMALSILSSYASSRRWPAGVDIRVSGVQASLPARGITANSVLGSLM